MKLAVNVTRLDATILELVLCVLVLCAKPVSDLLS